MLMFCSSENQQPYISYYLKKPIFPGCQALLESLEVQRKSVNRSRIAQSPREAKVQKQMQSIHGSVFYQHLGCLLKLLITGFYLNPTKSGSLGKETMNLILTSSINWEH